MPTIHKRVENRRGCGYRVPGGLYLVGTPHGQTCHKLPIELTTCPTCNQGIKPGRGFQWVSAKLFTDAPCTIAQQEKELTCKGCSMSVVGQMGLMWVGGKYYPSAAHFVQEARVQGISKRLPAVPLDFVPGSTWVALAHRNAIVDYSEGMAAYVDEQGEAHTGIKYKPGIFMLFRPTAVEYIVKGTETPEQLQRLEDRGLTLVEVIRDVDAQLDAFDEDPELEAPDLDALEGADYD